MLITKKKKKIKKKQCLLNVQLGEQDINRVDNTKVLDCSE
jgi:hypothetical protein